MNLDHVITGWVAQLSLDARDRGAGRRAATASSVVAESAAVLDPAPAPCPGGRRHWSAVPRLRIVRYVPRTAAVATR